MPLIKAETEVIIIGAGPAGAGASWFLSKYEIPHIVIEKETFPRDKVCGDACSGKTALVINRANPAWLTEILNNETAFLPSWGITFAAPNGKLLDIPFAPARTPATRAPGFTVPRMVFDDFLFSKMASPFTTLFQSAQVREINREGDKITVKMSQGQQDYEITAPLIIGADGDKSLVAKKLFPVNNPPKSYAVGLRAYYKGVTGMHAEHYIELHFLPEMLPGYLWIFPLPGGMANVGAGILSEKIRSKKINLRELMLNAIKNNPQIAPRFANASLEGGIQGWGLPMAMGQRPLSGDNFMLTGDAASLIDPFSGEGIGNALYSGMLAAAAVKEAKAQNNYGAAMLKVAYDDVVYKRLGPEFMVSATLQRLCNYPWLFNLVVNKAHKSRSLRDTISCMFSDMDLRKQLARPSFYFKILFNR